MNTSGVKERYHPPRYQTSFEYEESKEDSFMMIESYIINVRAILIFNLRVKVYYEEWSRSQ